MLDDGPNVSSVSVRAAADFISNAVATVASRMRVLGTPDNCACAGMGICSLSGTQTVNVAPRPSPSLVALIVPECNETIRCAMASPSPSP